jgi:hypothetical protein
MFNQDFKPCANESVFVCRDCPLIPFLCIEHARHHKLYFNHRVESAGPNDLKRNYIKELKQEVKKSISKVTQNTSAAISAITQTSNLIIKSLNCVSKNLKNSWHVQTSQSNIKKNYDFSMSMDILSCEIKVGIQENMKSFLSRISNYQQMFNIEREFQSFHQFQGVSEFKLFRIPKKFYSPHQYPLADQTPYVESAPDLNPHPFIQNNQNIELEMKTSSSMPSFNNFSSEYQHSQWPKNSSLPKFQANFVPLDITSNFVAPFTGIFGSQLRENDDLKNRKTGFSLGIIYPYSKMERGRK